MQQTAHVLGWRDLWLNPRPLRLNVQVEEMLKGTWRMNDHGHQFVQRYRDMCQKLSQFESPFYTPRW